jgi:hypothetical protein
MMIQRDEIGRLICALTDLSPSSQHVVVRSHSENAFPHDSLMRMHFHSLTTGIGLSQMSPRKSASLLLLEIAATKLAPHCPEYLIELGDRFHLMPETAIPKRF